MRDLPDAAPSPRGLPQTTVEDPLWWAWSDARWRSILHRAGVAAIRRLPLGGRTETWFRAWRKIVHRGTRVECPVCGSRFRHFQARWNTPDVICWSCGSEERHRTLWLLLDRLEPELLRGARSLLHFAPEPGLAALLRERVDRYVTCDIDPGAAELEIDITDIALPDESFDAIICSHVLEHIPDDRRAMHELQRVLAARGWLVVMVPIDHGLDATYEDPAIVDPEDRRRHFWQEDHVRLYALDVADRLAATGLLVRHLRPTEQLSEHAIERYRLGLGNDVFVCEKR